MSFSKSPRVIGLSVFFTKRDCSSATEANRYQAFCQRPISAQQLKTTFFPTTLHSIFTQRLYGVHQPHHIHSVGTRVCCFSTTTANNCFSAIACEKVKPVSLKQKKMVMKQVVFM